MTNNQHDNADDANNTCTYRKLKSDHSGDEGRPEWRLNE